MTTNRIKKIEIKGLLNKYKLGWDLKDDVNILVGINGSGKSTVLRSINALLSKNYAFLNNKKTNANIDIKILFENKSALSNCNGTKNPNKITVNHAFITTFDIPLKDKRSFSLSDTPLDKELRDLIYTVGKDQHSFSNYRFKATNFPEQAENINQKITGFFDKINRIFSETNKKISINPNTNELLFIDGEEKIPLEKLSSGEKQLLIILFAVFLMEESPYILLMDEPEISLHITWQEQLISMIRDLNPNCQLIISTHSPSIFGDGWGDKIFFIEDLIL